MNGLARALTAFAYLVLTIIPPLAGFIGFGFVLSFAARDIFYHAHYPATLFSMMMFPFGSMVLLVMSLATMIPVSACRNPSEKTAFLFGPVLAFLTVMILLWIGETLHWYLNGMHIATSEDSKLSPRDVNLKTSLLSRGMVLLAVLSWFVSVVWSFTVASVIWSRAGSNDSASKQAANDTAGGSHE